MAFDGAPERINSRLAMLGVVAAIAAELASGAMDAVQNAPDACDPHAFVMLIGHTCMHRQRA
jgi:hypothetical protein